MKQRCPNIKRVFKLRLKVASVHTIPLCWCIKESDTKCSKKAFCLLAAPATNYYWTIRRLPLAKWLARPFPSNRELCPARAEVIEICWIFPAGKHYYKVNKYSRSCYTCLSFSVNRRICINGPLSVFASNSRLEFEFLHTRKSNALFTSKKRWPKKLLLVVQFRENCQISV